jgi:hypothetical protein
MISVDASLSPTDIECDACTPSTAALIVYAERPDIRAAMNARVREILLSSAPNHTELQTAVEASTDYPRAMRLCVACAKKMHAGLGAVLKGR